MEKEDGLQAVQELNYHPLESSVSQDMLRNSMPCLPMDANGIVGLQDTCFVRHVKST